jgi:hypothetical protein
MPLDLEQIAKPKNRWLSLTGQLSGVDVLVRYATPKEQERFRQKLVREGVLKTSQGSSSINMGREDDFFSAFAKSYILDWRGDIKPEGTTYDAGQMGRILGASQSAFSQISDAVTEEADFLAENVDESSQS